MPPVVGEQDLVAVSGELVREERAGLFVFLDEQDRVGGLGHSSLLPVFVSRRRLVARRGISVACLAARSIEARPVPWRSGAFTGDLRIRPR